MDSEHTQTSPCLIVNRVEIITEGCSACGQTFASEPTGDKTLVASVGDNNHSYFFCGPCGDNIMGRVQNDQARQRYAWDFSVPLRNNRQ